METPRAASPLDPTLVVNSSDELPATPAGKPGEKSCEHFLCGIKGFIESSGAALSGQTQHVLAARLWAVSGVFFVGFFAFLVWRLIEGTALESPLLFGVHATATVVTAAAFLLLWRHQDASLPTLRVAELVVFGMPLVLFFVVQYTRVLAYAETDRVLIMPMHVWVLQIMVYSVFIPNTWRRAAAVVGLFAAAPLLCLLLLKFQSAAAAAVIGSPALVETAMLMGVVSLAAVLGVHMIGTLRREAFEARRLGVYQLKRQIGAGGMGEVYLGEHHLLKRPCAVKVIRPQSAADPEALARFEREVRATAALTHPNTVEIYDYGRAEDGTFYYVMEYLPGLTLAGLVELYGPLPPARVVYLLRQACGALAEAHAAGLIHRDIKPANIFVSERGGLYDVVKLLDFGLVKESSVAGDSHLTQEGTIAGSPLFISPEQALADRPDHRSDIYSLGAVAYTALVGRPPFEADNPMKVLVAHTRDAVVPPSERQPGVPEDLEEIVLRCLEKAAEDRFQSVEELERALGGCESAAGWDAHRAAAWWQKVEPEAVPSVA